MSYPWYLFLFSSVIYLYPALFYFAYDILEHAQYFGSYLGTEANHFNLWVTPIVTFPQTAMEFFNIPRINPSSGAVNIIWQCVNHRFVSRLFTYNSTTPLAQGVPRQQKLHCLKQLRETARVSESKECSFPKYLRITRCYRTNKFAP